MRFVFLIVFGGVGLGCLVGGGLWTKARLDLKSTGLRAKGEVVGHESHISRSSRSSGGSRSQTMYAERVRFQDHKNNTIEFVSDTSSSSPNFGVGETVDVIYPEKNSQKALIYSFSSFWLGPLILSVFGIVFLPVGIMAFFHIGSSDKKFQTAFFMHGKQNLGRFKQIEVSIIHVEFHEHDGQLAIGLTLTGKDPLTDERLEWTTPPRSYEYNRIPLDRSAAQRLLNQTMLLTYDPENTSDYHFNIFKLGASRAA